MQLAGAGRALPRPAQVLEDVSEEHARKTITMEPHPHGGAPGVQARTRAPPPLRLPSLPPLPR